MAGGDQGWPYDAWSTWAFAEYGRLKPVVKALQGEDPTAREEVVTAKGHIADAGGKLDQILELL